jgi:simple sugar transport system permease protein
MRFGTSCSCTGSVGVSAAAACISTGNSLAYRLNACLSAARWRAASGAIPACQGEVDANETLFTLMMNYIAIQLTSFFVAQWEHPFGSNSVGIINPTSKSGWFPQIFGKAYMLNVIIVLTITILMFIYLKYTKHGYEIAVVGESENTARYAAINVRKVIIRSMIISGAICGIADAMRSAVPAIQSRRARQAARFYSDHHCLACAIQQFCQETHFRADRISGTRCN